MMSSRGKAIEKPPVNKLLTYGAVIDWKFRPSVTQQRGKYCIHFTLFFESGENKDMQVWGFVTRAAAERAKESIIRALSTHRYAPFRFTVGEFYDYWLYYHKIDEAKITYGMFCNYRNIIYNYILKQWGRGMQMKEIGREECRAVLDTFPSKSLFTSGSHVLKNSFQYALEKNIIDSNQIPAAFILYTAKKEEPAVFMPLLFTITAGTLISESLGIRFSDIDFGQKVLRLKQQIGRSMDNAGLDTDELTLHAVAPKTENGYRDIPLPDFVLDEVILARKRYDLIKQCMPGFKDYGYVCCQDNGKPHNRSNLYKPYRRVLEACGFDYMVWHGLRHTYTSLLANGDISMKEIAKCMGHFDAGFTKEVYVTQQKTVYDGMKEAESFWKEIMPEDNVVLETGMEDELERYIMEVV